MVLRSDVLGTISVVSALLLLEIDDVLDGRIRTDPPELGVLAIWVQYLAEGAIWYTIMVSVSAAYYAEVYKVYADLNYPIYGICVAITSYFLTMTYSGLLNDFGFVDSKLPEDTWTTTGMRWAVFTAWFIPTLLIFVAFGLTVAAQSRDARSRTQERRDYGFKQVDEEQRLASDPLSHPFRGPSGPHAQPWGRH